MAARSPKSLKDLAFAMGATLHTGEGHAWISHIHASDTMSDLIAHAASSTLIVTNLNNMQLVRIAELMDAPAVCLAGGASPSPELLVAANRAGKAILATPLSLDEAERRLQNSLDGLGERQS